MVQLLRSENVTRGDINRARLERPLHPPLARVYDQWQAALALCNALKARPDVSLRDIAEAMTEAKQAVETEWGIKVPVVTDKHAND